MYSQTEIDAILGKGKSGQDDAYSEYEIDGIKYRSYGTSPDDFRIEKEVDGTYVDAETDDYEIFTTEYLTSSTEEETTIPPTSTIQEPAAKPIAETPSVEQLTKTVESKELEDIIKAQNKRKTAYVGASAGLESIGLALDEIAFANDPYLETLREIRDDKDFKKEEIEKKVKIRQVAQTKALASQTRNLLQQQADLQASQGGTTSARDITGQQKAIAEAALAMSQEGVLGTLAYYDQLEQMAEAEKEKAEQALYLREKEQDAARRSTISEFQKALATIGGYAPAKTSSDLALLRAAYPDATNEQLMAMYKMRSQG